MRFSNARNTRRKPAPASRHTSENRLLDDLVTIALVRHDLTLQFRAVTDFGVTARGLALLDKLDRHFSAT